MSVSLRRFGALFKKNLLVISRSPISTAIRVLIIPLLIVLFLSFSKQFFNSHNEKWGVGTPSPILSLPDALSHAGARKTVVFCDNGLRGGDVSRIIKSLATIVNEAGLNAVQTSNATKLSTTCESSKFTNSICFAGVIFFSSPIEGPDGVWNYTLGADFSLGNTANVDKTTNDAQIFLMPLQRAIDVEIAALSGSALPATVDQIQYTFESNEARQESVAARFLNACASVLGGFFFLALVPVIYHMTGFTAAERELGMAALVDASGFSRYGPQLLRLSSTYAAFVAVYTVSWLSCGIIVATVVFTRTNPAITIFYHLLNGLACCSFSLAGAILFRRAHLSGVFVVVVAVAIALLAQLLAPRLQTFSTVLVLSLLFPSANYTYMITTIARWESAGLATTLARVPPDSPFEIAGGIFWGFLVFQILVYPILAIFVERLLFGTSSEGYKQIAIQNDNNSSVELSNFSKTYKPSLFRRTFTKGNTDVHAVKKLSLVARPGTITMLLGPNGCGKSTTLDAIAGLSKISAGSVQVDRTGGLGLAPQRNVLWDELTVEEHIRIFIVLKSIGIRDVEAEVQSLIKDCDLEIKARAKAKTLSGGQKRKLHLAMMFAGGSRVCCVDEVSTGVDPVSRRKIWDILLAKRQGVCIIMTTHFLDEADWLADDIIIMAKGEERAHGTSAELKHCLGNGYSIHVSSAPNFILPSGIDLIEEIKSEGTTDYRVATSEQAAMLINCLETNEIYSYIVSGPTIEELFLKITTNRTTASEDDTFQVQQINSSNLSPQNMHDDCQHLLDGTMISVWKQSWYLFRKRCTIFRRNWMPYLAAAATALIGSAVTPYIFRGYHRFLCPQDQNIGNAYDDGPFGLYGENLNNAYVQMVMGPRSKISDTALQGIVDLYNNSHTNDYGYSTVPNVATFLNLIHFVETATEFSEYLALNHSSIIPGGFFLSDPPVMAWVGGVQDDIFDSIIVQNMVNILTGRVSISTSYEPFMVASTPQLIDFNTLIFVFIFGLVFSCYPAFFALYPTTERLQGVRSMQYSNGVRPAALWLAYLAFDTILVILINIVAIIVFSKATDVWFELPYIFAVLIFYGITSAIFSYIISMFARSPLAAWSIAAATQVVLYFVVFAAYVGIQSQVPYLQVEHEINYVQWTVGIISPGAHLQRALYVSLGLYTLTCSSATSAGDWSLYGGAIAYLILQGLLFLLILLLCDDGGSSLPSIGRRKQTRRLISGAEMPAVGRERKQGAFFHDDVVEAGQLASTGSGISVFSTTKSFGSNKAVDGVSLFIPPGETFALLGPNGAGKSTVISLIRGDVHPSTTESSIYIDNTSVLTHRTAARSKIGVCPQFDATDRMTVRESLLFFARIRGVPDPAHNVAAVIAACGLLPWSEKLAQTLSGGSKRKLSLAQALVGNPKVLLLDEPSSSLDAASKRVLWSTLVALAKDRAVLLTTHSMEEAQVLADRVGIISSRMLATGSVAEMCHDNVYHIHLVATSAPHTTQDEIREMMAWVRLNVPGANMDRETYCGQVRFSVTAGPSISVGGLFSLLESGKGQLGVGFYSVGRTTLDEVFVRVVREHGGREENSHVEEKGKLWKRWR